MKFLLLFTVSLVLSLSGIAQDSKGGIPFTFSHPETTNQIDIISIQPPDASVLQMEDVNHMQKSLPYRIGVCLPVDISITNSGTWTDLPEYNASLWRLSVKCENAKSIGFGYNQFYLPEGASLFIYNKDKTMLIGAYTAENNEENFFFSNQKVWGDEVTLELYVSNNEKDKIRLQINSLDYFYRAEEFNSGKGGSEACEVNINCPEGANWQDEKKGICKIDIKIGSNYYNCTGSLVNNTLQNCTPYVLLADHCHYDGGYASTSDYNSWKFYFHYEASNCAGTTGPVNQTKLGCTLKAHDTYGQNQAGSDFCLVQIKTAISSTLNVYYNGWDRNNTASTSGVGIHHPAGDIMKISTYTNTLTNAWGTHWQVTWAPTVTDHGVTEQGSSGSPIFNASGKIVGTLTGGNSFCDSPYSPDVYGKIYYHWDKNGSTADKRLKDWLDPNNSGLTSLAGTNVCPSSINKIPTGELSGIAYPSPAIDKICISVDAKFIEAESVTIFNVAGEKVVNIASLPIVSGQLEINIGALPDGLYFINAIVDGNLLKSEFLKSK